MFTYDLSRMIFDPAKTFDSGQTFRWWPIDETKNAWEGIVSGHLLSVTRTKAISLNSAEDYSSNFFSTYFSETDDVEAITNSFPRDDYLSKSLKEYRGLRILTQDPWECLVSFLCSINSNIPSIRLKIENLSRHFGKQINLGSRVFYSFPEPAAIAKASKSELLSCKLGFRWRYVHRVASEVTKGNLVLEDLRKSNYEEACNQIISSDSRKTLGVGPKVADCFLLFSLHQLQAFPIDVWIAKCLRENYRTQLEQVLGKSLDRSLTRKFYAEIGNVMRQRFGKYAGYAQQFLYMKTRNDRLL